MYYNDIISRKYEVHVLIRTYEKSSRMKEKLHWKTFARENMSSRATAMTFFYMFHSSNRTSTKSDDDIKYTLTL